MTARTRSLRLVGVNLIRINGDDLVAADCEGLRDAGAGYRVFSKDIPAAPSHAVTVYYLMVLAALGYLINLAPTPPGSQRGRTGLLGGVGAVADERRDKPTYRRLGRFV